MESTGAREIVGKLFQPRTSSGRSMFTVCRIVTFALAILPLSVAPALGANDCNGNGREDAVDVAEGTSDDCNGNGTPDECEGVPLALAPGRESQPLDAVPRVIRAGDLDGDEHLDLVVAARGARDDVPSRVFVLHGLAGRAFARPQPFEAGTRLWDLALADMDLDGDTDVVVAERDTILILSNDGVGQLSATVAMPQSDEVRRLLLDDVDGDGSMDIAVTLSGTGSIAILWNRGEGDFEESRWNDVADEPSAIAATDVNLDGLTDLVVSGRRSGAVSVLLGEGDGRFAAGVTYPVGGDEPFEVAAADLDADGLPDLAVATRESLSVLLNSGSGEFGVPVAYPGFGASLGAIDIDRDGDLDLVRATASPRAVSVRLNDGSGGFSIERSVSTGRLVNSLVPADLDGDGDTDVGLTSTAPASVSFLWNGEESTLAAETREVPLGDCLGTHVGCAPHAGVLVDLDLDGDLDVVASTTFPATLVSGLNRGDATFDVLSPHVFSGSQPLSATAGDVTGDGLPDVVTADYREGVIHVHPGRGDGTFDPAVARRVGALPLQVELVDIDGDGDLDAITANQGDNTVAVVRNDGTGPAPDDRLILPARPGPVSVAAGDLDGDGLPEIVVAGSLASEVSVFRGIGGGVFGERVDHVVRGRPNFVRLADVDRDGDTDVVAASASHTSVQVLVNAGAGRLLPGPTSETVHPPYSLFAADHDGDGFLDLVAGNEQTSTVSIMTGRGDGRFDYPIHVAVGRGLRFALPGDMDGDGDPDIVTTNRLAASLTLVRNDSVVNGSEDYLDIICTPLDFHRLSAPSTGSVDAERYLKCLIPARDDPSLLPTLFQNTRRYELHQEFLAAAFPGRFPLLDSAAYLDLVGSRANRSYFAGAISRLRDVSGPVYGFSVFANFADSREAPTAAEMARVYDRLDDVFRPRPLVYAPIARAAVSVAESWGADPGFPVRLRDSSGGVPYRAYTRGTAYGRVRRLDAEALASASESGRIGFQDILVLEEAPRDIEGVMAGVVTAEPQGELSHLIVRSARRGTPNAYLRDAQERFAAHEGDLVRLVVETDGLEIVPATLDEAQAHWEASRPRLRSPPPLDPDFEEILDLRELAALDTAPGPWPLEARVGGKASQFARLQRVLEEGGAGLAAYIEPGFAVPVRHYLDFMSANLIPSLVVPGREVTYARYLEELLAYPRFQTDSKFRLSALAFLRDHGMRFGTVDRELVNRLAVAVRRVFGTDTGVVRFRSSSNVEDSLEFNGAGLYDSTSACAADDLDGDGVGPSICDPERDGERGIARALRAVWLGLWNFRAHEEREYYGIPPGRVAMGVLVTRAFRGEQVNGVIFTGNPDHAGDPRFIVVAQVGETSVVSPPPGVDAEKSVLDVVDGEVVRIHRARFSSLLPDGQLVMSDAALEELGELVAYLDRSFPLDLADHSREEVLLDLEFKLEAGGELALKQVRPFLRSAAAATRPRFELEIPPGLALGGEFVPGRSLDEEHQLGSLLTLRAGIHELLPDAPGPAGAFLAGVRFGRKGEEAAPVSAGTLRHSTLTDGSGELIHRFEFEQDFAPASGGRLTVRILDLDFRDGGPEDRRLALDMQRLESDIIVQGEVEMAGGGSAVINYAALPGDRLLPLWLVRARLEDGTSLLLEERFRPEPLLDSGPAALVRAEVLLAGGPRIEVADGFRLVYAANRHNTSVRYRVDFGRSIDLESAGTPVRGVDLAAPEPREGTGATAWYLDGALARIAPVEVIEFSRGAADEDEPGPFRRGDASGDGTVDLTDAVFLIDFFFRRGTPPGCTKAADANDDGRVNPADIVVVLRYGFLGHELPGPGTCGRDATPDELECDAPGDCG